MATCGHTGRLSSMAIKKESTWGTYITPDISVRYSSESLNRVVAHSEDDANVGEIFTTDMVKVADGAGGGVEAKLHPDTAGVFLNWALGGENAVANPPDAYVIINYTGSENYARLTLTSSALLAEDSSDGSSWAADTNFNTTGTLDISAAPSDTAAEVAALIDGYTGWNASYVGSATGDTSTVADFAATQLFNNDQKVGAVILQTAVTSTVAKVHDVIPAAAGTCLPSYSVQVNRTLGTDKSLAYVGAKVTSLSITTTNKELNTISLTLSSKAEEVDKTDVTLTIPVSKAYTGLKTTVMLDELKTDDVKDLTFNLNNNLDESSVLGSENIVEQIRQGATADISFNANLDNPTTDVYSKRSNYINDIPMEVIVYMESTSLADTANSVPFSILLRLNRVKFTDFNAPIAGPDRITIATAGTVVKPVSTYEHVEALIVDEDVTTY